MLTPAAGRAPGSIVCASLRMFCLLRVQIVLRVLRSSREALLTVVEVVLHDPLCRWALTPVKAKQRQREAAAEGLEGMGSGGGGGVCAACLCWACCCLGGPLVVCL